MKQESIEKSLEKAANAFGSEAALARALGVTRGAFNQWKRPGREVPARHAPEIERLTGVLCESLCFSVDWSVLRKRASSRKRVAAQGS
ncbi:transcriptional regulator [Paenalcaligenes sp. Me131]|uniref:transcriptional regulator n=1 Tax=Paenalcaligenes sp. Me131 TaxID=3392636 RepID=UPI003D2947FC